MPGGPQAASTYLDLPPILDINGPMAGELPHQRVLIGWNSPRRAVFKTEFLMVIKKHLISIRFF